MIGQKNSLQCGHRIHGKRKAAWLEAAGQKISGTKREQILVF